MMSDQNISRINKKKQQSWLLILLLSISWGCEDAATIPPQLYWQSINATNDMEVPLTGVEQAGESMAGESMAGESMAGENMAGESMAGENMAGMPTPSEPINLPRVIVEDPPRAHFTADESWTVTGYLEDERNDIESLEIQTLATPFDLEKLFSQEVPLAHGPNIIASEAFVEGRKLTADYRTVVSGLHLPEDYPTWNGLEFTITTPTMNEIASRIDEFIEPADFNAVIVNPVLSEDQTFCFGFCYTAMGIFVNAYNPNFSGIDAYVTPQDDGLVVSFMMTDFEMDWDGTAVVSEIGYSGQGRMYAEAMMVDMLIGIEWTRERRLISVLGTQVQSRNVVYDFADPFYQASQFFGMPVDAMMTSVMESTFEDLLASQVPRLLYEIIDEDAQINAEIAIDDQKVQLDGQVMVAEVSQAGLTFWYDMLATPSQLLHPVLDTRWFSDTPAPVVTTDEQRAKGGFALEAMNGILHAVWQAGGLDFVLPGDQLGLSADVMEQLIPGTGEVDIHLTSGLPPLIHENIHRQTPWITIGDVEMSVTPRGASIDQTLIKVIASIRGQLGMRVQGESLVPELLMPEVYPTIVYPTAVDPLLAIGIPTVLIPLSQSELPIILANRVSFPLDLINGFMLSDAQVSAAEGRGYILDGMITARP